MCMYMYIVELHEAEKPIFTIIDTMCVNVPSASWTDYPISKIVKGIKNTQRTF